MALTSKEPRLFIAQYTKRILQLTDQVQDVIRKAIVPALKKTEREDAFPRPIQTQLDIIELKLGQLLKSKKIPKDLNALVKQLSASNTKQWGKLLGIPIDPAVGPLLGDFVELNTNLIKSQTSQTVTAIRRLIEGRVGDRHESIAKDIEQLFGVQKSRAKFIARDQVLKLNGDITRTVHQSVGILEYEWSTSKDERVRETHADLDGRRFRYDDPPDVDGRKVNPGEDYQCRCVAFPVLPVV